MQIEVLRSQLQAGIQDVIRSVLDAAMTRAMNEVLYGSGGPLLGQKAIRARWSVKSDTTQASNSNTQTLESYYGGAFCLECSGERRCGCSGRAR